MITQEMMSRPILQQNSNMDNVSDPQNEEEVECTDTDSEAGSDVSLHNYKTDNSSDNKISDHRLRKITNPQMVQKFQQYLSLKSTINDESVRQSSKRRSFIIRAKRNK